MDCGESRPFSKTKHATGLPRAGMSRNAAVVGIPVCSKSGGNVLMKTVATGSFRAMYLHAMTMCSLFSIARET